MTEKKYCLESPFATDRDTMLALEFFPFSSIRKSVIADWMPVVKIIQPLSGIVMHLKRQVLYIKHAIFLLP